MNDIMQNSSNTSNKLRGSRQSSRKRYASDTNSLKSNKILIHIQVSIQVEQLCQGCDLIYNKE